jgi:transposase
MTRKAKTYFTPEQKLEYAKLMVDDGYTYKRVQEISGAGLSAISRWKKQYQEELIGITPASNSAITPEQQRIQELEKQLKRAHRDNDILKKATAFFIRDNHNLN